MRWDPGWVAEAHLLLGYARDVVRVGRLLTRFSIANSVLSIIAVGLHDWWAAGLGVVVAGTITWASWANRQRGDRLEWELRALIDERTTCDPAL